MLSRLRHHALFLSCAAALVVPVAAQDPPVPAQDSASEDTVVVLAAGDIAKCAILPGAVATARLLDRLPGTVLTLGDHAYETGSAAEFEKCYTPTWGRHRDRTRPSPGNHDYGSNKAKAYFDYFGERAGPPGRGYYSFDLARWHLVSLNSFIDAGPNSPQMKWLKEDLDAHPSDCLLAYWHIPIFSSGPHGADVQMKPAWRLLLAAGAEIVLNGHDHDYERFAPQDDRGRAIPNGIRQFVVGTGGGGVYRFKNVTLNSEVRDNSTYGVLKLTLKPGAYDWEFVPIDGQTFTDRGSGTCTPRP